MLESNKFILGARYHFIATEGISAGPGGRGPSWHLEALSSGSVRKDVL